MNPCCFTGIWTSSRNSPAGPKGSGPWTPVIRGENLYGRGGADDGYAMYGALSAILALHDQKIPHARCVILIEACEESGSYDLPFYVDHLAERIGKPGSGGLSRFRLRRLRPAVADHVVARHGDRESDRPCTDRRGAFGRCFRHRPVQFPHPAAIAVPPRRRTHRRNPAARTSMSIFRRRGWRRRKPPAPFSALPSTTNSLSRAGTRPMATNPAELILNRTWRPQLAIIGVDGLAGAAECGQCAAAIHHRETVAAPAADLSRRCDELAETAADGKSALWRGSHVRSLDPLSARAGTRPSLRRGWKRRLRARRRRPSDTNPPIWARAAVFRSWACWARNSPRRNSSSPACSGPHSNAHGPNEFLHIPTGKRVTETIAHVLSGHLGHT